MKIIKYLSHLFGYVAAVMLGLMMAVTVVDVIGRYIFNAPIIGATEIQQLLMVLVVFLSLAWISVERSHIMVDLLLSRLSTRARLAAETATLFLGFVIYLILTWQGAVEAMGAEETTSLLSIPEAPFRWAAASGLAVLCLSIICHMIDNFRILNKGER